LLALLSLPAFAFGGEEGLKITYHGAGWIQGGEIVQAADTLSDGDGQNFRGNRTQNAGGQITAEADLGGGWEGALGLGAIQSPAFFRGSIDYDKVMSIGWAPYVTEARLTYTVGEPSHPALQITAGSFHFNYNSDVKNLGLYLLRGMAYPGIVISGFETRDVLPIANVFGADIRHERGGYRGDFIVNSETAVNPYFDLSFAYVFNYRFLGAVEVGAGANWYRALPQRSRITSPGKDCQNGQSQYTINRKDVEVCYILDSISVPTSAGADTVAVDTVTGSLSGVKLMGRVSVDPKPLLGLAGPFGPRDLILYSEAAVLGLKDYPKYYADIMERIPVMVGFNLPVFGYLDELSLEVEHYANRNMTDYQKVVEDNSWVPRPRARVDLHDAGGKLIGTYVTDTRSDDWKWSLYGCKVIAGHLKLSAQVANDHLRTGGYFLQATQSETLSDTFDWYWMFKIGYYF
jgi:hypothetical protein